MPKESVLKGSPHFFKNLVNLKMAESGVSVSPEVKAYLSSLLEFYILTNHLYSPGRGGKKHIKTLAEMYLGAHSASSYLNQQALKKVGDTSLYISGFFRESLKRKTVSVDYYISMGRQAYASLGDLKNQALFKELSARFLDLMFILFRIQQHALSQAPYLMSLLNQYMDTGSPSARAELMRLGINIGEKNQKTTTH